MKKMNVKREIEQTLRALALAIKQGLVKKCEKSGGYSPAQLANAVDLKKGDLLRALKVWFQAKIARFNNKMVHIDVRQIGKFA